LESEAPEIFNSAQRITKRLNSDTEKMKKLRDFTNARLANNLQFAGYFTALEAYERRMGDCTEYALLLAALGRSAGIPTRILFGLSYSRERFHGHANVFIPHTWVQAWIDGRWQSFDAALSEFDAGHIALAVSSDGSAVDFDNNLASQYTQITSALQVIKRAHPSN
jgi:transglutaminase-like putative cysteine protease